MGLLTWKLDVPCPQCGKSFLLAEVGGLVQWTRVYSYGKLDRIPNNLWCEFCGPIPGEYIVPYLPLPVRRLRQCSLTNMLLFLVPALIALAIILVLLQLFI